MIDLINYNVLSTFYDGDDMKIVRVCNLNNDEKEIVKIVRKKGSPINGISSVEKEYELLKELNNFRCRHIINAKEAFDFEKNSYLVLQNFDGLPLLQLSNEIRETSDDYIGNLLEIAIDLAEAVEHIHLSGTIHNDLRTDRILVNPNSSNIVIIDFSCASPSNICGIDPDKLTTLIGLFPYISPERTKRTRYKIDQRSDLYSLGIVLYEIFSGELPFVTEDVSELVHCHMAVNPIALSDLIEKFPIMISSIIQKLINKELTDRYQSAKSLKSDLIYCKEQWNLNKNIPLIKLGENDYFGTIRLPQKLYGRDKELLYMKEWFEKSTIESTQMLLVSGYSGIGKTSLVQESCQYYIHEESFFIKGKFEQSKNRIPYFALSQLFTALIRKIISEEAIYNQLYHKCIEALGEQAGVLVPLIPNLEDFLGKQKEVTKIDPKQVESRMYYALKTLLKTITTLQRPFIFLIDDIQWADEASINMISNLLNMGLMNTFLICVYRENEIENQIKLKETITLWQKGFNAKMLHLKSLEKDYIEQFVADSLHMKKSEIKELAHLIQEKTQGNIFFIRQFLIFLHNKGMLYLYFDENEAIDYRWHWDIETIDRQYPTDNVIDIILENLKLKSQKELKVIKIAACIGNYFDFDILNSVYNMNSSRLYSVLFNFSKSGIITSDKNRSFFTHDRIHQAIYSMVNSANLPKIHLKIGKVMIETLSSDIIEEKIFDVVFQWNQGESEIKNTEDIITAAKVNLQAARKAEENSAYIEAKIYGKKALDFLSISSVEQNNKLILEIYDEMSQINFLLNDHEESYIFTVKALEVAETVEEKFNAFRTRAEIEMASSHLREAIDIALEYVELLGEKVDINNTRRETLFALANIKYELGINPAEKLAALPKMVNCSPLLAVKMLSYVISSAYMISPTLHAQILVKMVQLSLKYGTVSEASIAWVTYAGISQRIYADWEGLYKLGETAINIRGKFMNQEVRSKFAFIISLEHLKQPFRSILKSCLELYEEGLKIGDIEDSCQGLLQYGNMAFHAGCELTELKNELFKMYDIVDSYKQKTVKNRLSITLQVILNLCESNKPYVLCGNVFDENKMLNTLKKLEDSAAVFIWASQKVMLCCLFHKYKEINKIVRLVEKHKAYTEGQIFVFDYHYYVTLCNLRIIGTVDKINEKKIREIVKEHFKKVELWVQRSERNYTHKYLILKAEFNRITGNKSAALELYNSAIENAIKNDFIQDAAFAMELLGLYHLEMDNTFNGEMYLNKAIEYYEKWGAFTKVEQIKEQYLLKKKDELKFQTVEKTNESSIDLHSILLAAQALSKEIEINSLIKKMMQIVMVNSGSTKAVFLEYQNGELVVETGCIAETSNDIQNNNVIQFINCIEEIILPWSVVDYTIEHQELILLDYPSGHLAFSEDSYIQQNKPKSALCLPLNRKNNLVGIIYLENRIFSGAFTSKQIEIIKMISTQIAISLENARLYSNLEEKVKERTIELNDTGEELKSQIDERKNAERALSEKEEKLRIVKEYDKLKTEFFANISHELKTPLNVIYSALQMCEIITNDNHSKKNDINKYLQMIKQNCFRSTRLINNIIDITKIDSGYLKISFKNEEIVSVVENIVMSVVNYAQSKGIIILFDTDVEERTIACDVYKIERVILNLLSNAIKFTDKGGHIYVNIYNKEKSIMISVKDTGIGIPKEKLDIIFERFIQVDKSISRNNEGSGIGLSLVKELVTMHSGTISVNSTIGKGTEFILELPVLTTNENILHEEIYEKLESDNDKIEKIKIEFSDIYF
ncbi:AAA family ATPase [Clostridium sediminicola]|uniref:ATP-binding protein n=1 Tax=Clostridium sediminicola TaxID=3114879 RepID=UPI0031F27605